MSGDAPGTSQQPAESATLTSAHARFVWPPVPEPQPVSPSPVLGQPSPAAVERAPRDAGRLLAWVRAAESFWLAPTALPLARRIADLGWTADDFDAYCNRCGGDVGRGEEDEFGCARCRETAQPWQRFVRLGAYEGDLAEWIKELKFTRNVTLGVGLGRLLADRLVEAGLPRDRVCVVPVGMSLRRRWARGVDHAGAIAEGVARGLGAPLVGALRRFHRESQRRMPSRTAREANARRSFKVRSGVDLAGWTVVLVDDVSTTGATLRAASRAMLAKRRRADRPCGIWIATAAVTPDRGGRGARMDAAPAPAPGVGVGPRRA